MATLSNSERGRKAEKTPTVRPMISQRTAPPKTSDAVTGAAAAMMSLTGVFWTNDVPSD